MFAAAFASAMLAASAPNLTGSAFVTSLPAGAEVWVDGAYVGQAPVFVELLAPGKHSVTVSRAGWSPKLAGFEVRGAEIVEVSVTLDRSGSPRGGSPSAGQGMLAVRGSPLGARVTIDGMAGGTLPALPKKIAAGRHIVAIQVGRSAPIVHAVTVYPDTMTVALFGNQQSDTASASHDVLAPLDQYVPAQSFTTAGNEIAIHYRGVEVECSIGARGYTFNGRAGTLTIAPALVEGRVYLPLELLQRIAGAAR